MRHTQTGCQTQFCRRQTGTRSQCHGTFTHILPTQANPFALRGSTHDVHLILRELSRLRIFLHDHGIRARRQRRSREDAGSLPHT